MWWRGAILGLGLAALLPEGRASVLGAMRDAATELRADGAPGVSMAVVVRGRTYFWSEGSSGRPGLVLDERTLFETASISKVFTTTLLGIDVARGVRSLHDPIGKSLPGVPLCSRMQRATLEMLATFTAGLPGLPPDFRALPSSEQGVDFYSVADFLRFVSRWQPATNLPAPRAYSDASVGLLGLCLGDLRLGTWESRLRRRIFLPLGMRDTEVSLTSVQQRRLAAGVTGAGEPAPPWPVDAFAAADGVKSTAADLARFVRALLGERAGMPAALAAGMRIATDSGFPIFGGHGFQALAWTWASVSVRGAQEWVITKNGNIPGFSSQISFSRDLEIGAAILSNRGDLPIRTVELNLLARIARERD